MQDPIKGTNGLIRIRNAIYYSFSGLAATYRHEAAFRQELWLALVFIPLALWLTHDRVSRVLLISSVLLVLLMELVNSAIEATVDRISDERHPLAKRAKDIGSATVFISIVNVVIVWALILG